jgi:hypothetical protein
MATLSASTNGRTVNWTISGLSNKFDTRYYQQAGICLTPFSDGAASISNVVDTKNATTYQAAIYSYDYLGEDIISFTSSISGWTSYGFESDTGLFYGAGDYVTLNPGSTNDVIYSPSMSYLYERWTDGDLYVRSTYRSYLYSAAVEGSTTVSDTYTSSSGNYTLYAWAKANNGLYYNAGSYTITVIGDGVVKIDTASGWVNAIPYIDTPSGWVVPEVWIDSPSGWVKTTS